MAEPAAVTDPTEDPKKGKSRAQSKTQFPYYDLADAVKVATAIHAKAGGQCTRAQLSGLLNHKSVRSGAFLSRVAGAKMFGLIEKADGSNLRVTPRGERIVAPVDERQTTAAKVEAFLDVELFKKVFDKYQGKTLPGSVGLQNLFGTEYGIVKSRQPPTVRIMRASAQFAGFFDTAGSTQMVNPVGLQGSYQDPPPNPPEGGEPRPKGGDGGNSNVGGPDAGHIDPAIIGLLQKLPPSGTPLNQKKREKLINAFESFVAFIYPDPDDD